MNNADPTDPATLKEKLNRDTAKINWLALAEHHANDAVIEVGADLDLIHVACEFVRDNRDQVAKWLDAGQVVKVSDQKAASWEKDDSEVWAVVVAPWVLVQVPAR